MEIVAGLIALLTGAGVAFFNNLLAKKAVAKDSGKNVLPGLALLRQTINVGVLVLIYLMRDLFRFPISTVLVGAALGMTIPSIIFALKMKKANKAGSK